MATTQQFYPKSNKKGLNGASEADYETIHKENAIPGSSTRSHANLDNQKEQSSGANTEVNTQQQQQQQHHSKQQYSQDQVMQEEEEAKAAAAEIVDQDSLGSDESMTSTSSSSGYLEPWIDGFLGKKGNEYFCEIDVDYITDRFNLMGLNRHISTRFSTVINFIVDELDDEQLSKLRGSDYEQLCKDAAKLYGLIHARYIITLKGLDKMMHKYREGDFGKCPRVFCEGQNLLPVGLHDSYSKEYVKLYCPCCEDVYVPKSTRHSNLDGSFFGTTFPGIFLQQYPKLVPVKPIDNYVPKINGFELHRHAQWARWQELQRLKHLRVLTESYGLKNVEGGFDIPGSYHLQPLVNSEKIFSSEKPRVVDLSDEE
ncbi:hypothetical protein ACO0QE_004744 [Hanseniaspora vineae]